MDSNLVNNQYSLSIRILSDGFSLCVYDEKHTIISRKNIMQEQQNDISELLENLLGNNEEVHQNYRDTAIICESGFYTIIPEVFYKPEKERAFLQLQHPSLPDRYQTFHFTFSNQQCVLIFGLEENIIQLFGRYLSHSTPELHLVNIIKNNINEGDNKVTVWIRQEEIDCIVYKDRKLILLNKFNYQSPEDIVYHILNIHQQLNLNPNEIITEVFSDGNLQTEKLIRNYIPKFVIKSKQIAHEDYQWKT